jgi:hypothetical protein
MIFTREAERGQEESLENRVVNIVLETQRVLAAGRERFPSYKENPYEAALKETIGGLDTAQLAELIAGNPVESMAGQDITEYAASVHAWSAEVIGKRSHELASSAYAARQDEIIRGLLEGKLITAKARKGTGSSKIASGHAFFTIISGALVEVSGIFHSSDVNNGNLILRKGGPMESAEAQPPEDDSIISAERRQYYRLELTWLGNKDPDKFIDKKIKEFIDLGEAGARHYIIFDNYMDEAIGQLQK